MKALLILIVVGILGLVAVYFFGGISTMDPAQQAAEFQNKVEQGMSWEQVVQIAKPREVTAMKIDRDGMRAPGATFRYKPEEFKAALDDNKFPEGFRFTHVFSANDSFEVTFSAEGKVQNVDKMISQSDILEGKLAY